MKQDEAIAEWVHGLAPWQVFSTLTFEGEFTRDAAARAYERFMRKALPKVTYFYSIERNPSREGHHVHAMWADAETVPRKHVWKEWKNRHGRNRIEPVKSKDDVSGYCAKYVTKEGAWWNFKLQPHRWAQNARQTGV